ncbi:MAG: aspartate/glutamate racemase family protein [Xanthomonadales bacterium]|nr:aspartate/glutamate racemase family protein [Xanthomonadales bacterium]
MKTLGLIGGMSWESTLPYYRFINEAVGRRLGGLHSAKLVLYSVDFAEIERMQRDDAWDEAGAHLADAARTLESAGASLIVLCTNTMHKVAEAIEASVAIPLLHIADATGVAVRQAGLRRVGLLGTRFTMEQAFYRDRLQARHGLDVIVPDEADRDTVHRVIYEELCRGRFLDAARTEFCAIIQKLVDGGAEAIILGCTEIGLLVRADDVTVPLFDTARLHAEHAVAVALDVRPEG